MSHWRRIVIDSRYKTDDSASDSDFHIQIPYPVRVPQGSHLFVDGVTLGHSWPTVSTSNNKVYVEEQLGAPGSSASYNRIVELTPGTYNGAQLAAELQTQLNAGSLINNSGTYQYTCTLDDGRITVQHSIPNSAGRSYLYSKEWTDEPATYLKMIHVPYPGQSANELLGYMTNPNLNDQYIHSGQSLTFSFLDLQYHHQLFLCSPGLGESSMMLANGDTTCIRRILCGSTMQGDVILDTLSTGLAPVTFTTEEVLHRMHFILKGWDGKPVATGGHQLSFELIIQRPE